MLQLDTKRHQEEENAVLREEIARLRALFYGKKSERVVAANLDLTIEEVPAKDEPNAPATDKTQQNKTDPAAKRTRRLREHYTREIEETLIPDEVKAAPADYERLPESAERVSVRVENVPAHLALHIYRCPAFVRIGKRGRKKQQAPIRAAAPATILPGSSIGNSIIARLLHGKYELKLPLTVKSTSLNGWASTTSAKACCVTGCVRRQMPWNRFGKACTATCLPPPCCMWMSPPSAA